MKIIKTMEELGTAIDAGVIIEFKRAGADEWILANSIGWLFSDIVKAVEDGRCRTAMTFIEGPGGRFEYPVPLSHTPANGDLYYVCDISDLAIGECFWSDNGIDLKWFDAKIIHTNSEAAELHLEAYCKAMGIE